MELPLLQFFFLNAQDNKSFFKFTSAVIHIGNNKITLIKKILHIRVEPIICHLNNKIKITFITRYCNVFLSVNVIIIFLHLIK